MPARPHSSVARRISKVLLWTQATCALLFFSLSLRGGTHYDEADYVFKQTSRGSYRRVSAWSTSGNLSFEGVFDSIRQPPQSYCEWGGCGDSDESGWRFSTDRIPRGYFGWQVWDFCPVLHLPDPRIEVENVNGYRVEWDRGNSFILNIPEWWFMVLLSIYPARRLWRWNRRRRRKNAGECLQCGYILAGLPTPRCPECGTPFGGPTISREP